MLEGRRVCIKANILLNLTQMQTQITNLQKLTLFELIFGGKFANTKYFL